MTVRSDSNCELAQSACFRVCRGRRKLAVLALVGILGVVGAPPQSWATGLGGDLLPRVDTEHFDELDAANVQPGVADVVIGGGAAVSSFNGNLLIRVPASTQLPQDGRLPALGFGLTYNSKKVQLLSVNGSGIQLTGKSWVGLGWTGHLGRIFRTSRYSSVSNDYSGFVTSFEFPDGSLLQFEPEVKNAHPDVQIQYLRDCTGQVPPPPCNICDSNQHYDAACCDDVRNGVAECAGRGGDLVEHYDVSFPDGTVYRLEKIIPYDYAANQWIRNSDRAGYYTTKIRDAFGNAISISYAASTDPFPEAITRIHSVQDSTAASDIVLTRCIANDPDSTRCPFGTEGMLKDIQSASFKGARSAAQTTTVQMSYNLLSTYPGGATFEVPWTQFPTLSGITVVGSNQEVGGSTLFNYQDGPKTYPLIDRIRTALGAVFQFDYGTWRSGSRGTYAVDRVIAGVTKETTFPEGLGANDDPTGRSHFEWHWSRDLSATTCSPTTTGGTNDFEVIAPDNRRTMFTVQGDHCGQKLRRNDLSAFGVPGYVRLYQGNPGVPLRTRSSFFSSLTTDPDGEVIKPISQGGTTSFDDDKDVCFETPSSSTNLPPRVIDVKNYARDGGSNWQQTVLTSNAYMPFLTSTTVATQVTQTTFADLTACPHFLRGFPSGQAIEEGLGQLSRAEESFQWDCSGQLTQSDITDEWKTSVTQDAPSSVPAIQAPDTDDLEKTYAYFSNGNLQRVTATKSGGYPGATHDYTTTSTWDKGQIATQSSPDITAYNLLDVTPDVGGQVWKRRDPNGLEATYDYDALGRLTEVDPPGPVEQKTRTIFDADLHHIRTITSPGTETQFDSSNNDQLYSEQILDQLGRVIQINRAMPSGGLSAQLTRYDQFGRVIFVSNWLPVVTGQVAPSHVWSSDVDTDGVPEYSVDVPVDGSLTPLGTVTFYGAPNPSDPLNPLMAEPDGLGRVRRIVRADGSSTDYEYCGPHVQTTVHGIRTSLTGSQTSDAVTRKYYDALGRLVLVDAPAGSADAEYSYDARGNLTRVNLVEQLPSNPYDAWRHGTILPGQVRTFNYDAAGRLISRQSPEKGLELFGKIDGPGPEKAYYDPAGNPLIYVDALGKQRGYFFKSTYDAIGRPLAVERVLGAPGAQITAGASKAPEWNDQFNRWTEGTISIDGNTFTAFPSPYLNVTSSCIPTAPQNGYPSNTSGTLYIGVPSGPDGCTYIDLPTTALAMRGELLQVTKDDVLTFKYWRHVRFTSSHLDSFQVYVKIFNGLNGDVTNRRLAFKLDSGQESFGKWQQTYPIRLSDLFTKDEWPEGSSQHLNLFFTFQKGDDNTVPVVDPGIGIADVYVGPDVFPSQDHSVLANYTYDTDMCLGSVPPAGDACSGGDDSVNRYKGQLSMVESNFGLRPLERRRLVYKGLNGRVSGENESIDWDGDGGFDSWVSRVSYGAQGNTSVWTSPYLAGIDLPRLYAYSYKRGYVDGLIDASTNFPLIVGGGTPSNLQYTAAGQLSEMMFSNGAQNNYSVDVLGRTAGITVTAPASGGNRQTLWATGLYQYDGADNITGIGAQQFSYDLARQLTHAQVLPQTTSPSESVPYDLTSVYDPYGNMKVQTWSHSHGVTAPPGFPFSFDYDDATNHVQGNSSFVYDLDGAMVRAPGSTGGATAMSWDREGRLSAFFNGTPEDQSRPTERYAVDAGGFRLVRWPESGSGAPVITLRSVTGKTRSEFVADPASNRPILSRENIYLGETQIAERRPQGAAPTLASSESLYKGGAYGFIVSDDNAPADFSGVSYSVDIRTPDGTASALLENVQPDSDGSFSIPESALAPGQENWVSVRRNSAAGEPYSNVSIVAFDPSVNLDSDNQVRAISVSRVDSDVVVRWTLSGDNEKRSYVYFHAKNAEEPTLLTPDGLDPGTTEFVLPYPGSKSPCGYFEVTQTDVDGFNPTGPSIGADLPSSAGMSATLLSSPCDSDEPFDDGPDPPIHRWEEVAPTLQSLVTTFHHRDHLGSLRVLTDSLGHSLGAQYAHDYYPFGREIDSIGADLNQGAVSRFTGHERDVLTGMDYMVMRSKNVNYPFFATPDPLGNANGSAPVTWNRYAYVGGNPLSRIDPLGLIQCDEDPACLEATGGASGSSSGGSSGVGDPFWNAHTQENCPFDASCTPFGTAGSWVRNGVKVEPTADLWIEQFGLIQIRGIGFLGMSWVDTYDGDNNLLTSSAKPYFIDGGVSMSESDSESDIWNDFKSGVLNGNRTAGEGFYDCVNRNLDRLTGGMHSKIGGDVFVATFLATAARLTPAGIIGYGPSGLGNLPISTVSGYMAARSATGLFGSEAAGGWALSGTVGMYAGGAIAFTSYSSLMVGAMINCR